MAEQLGEVEELVRDWAERTEQILKEQFAKRKINQDELQRSIRFRVYQQSASLIGVDLHFLGYGRFVDMGVGRGAKQSLEGSRKLKGRKPKKWYSRPFYSRLYALNSIVMAELAETAIKEIKNIIEK